MKFGYKVIFSVNDGVLVVGLGAQYRAGKEVYLLARWNAAHVSSEKRWSLDPDAYRRGIGLTVGAETLVGPLEVTFVSRTAKGPYDLQVNVGHVF